MSDTVLKDNKEDSAAIAGKIRELSSEIDNNFTKASNLFLNGDPSEWAGKDADSYKQKLQDLAKKVQDSIRDIKYLADKVQFLSDQISENEITNKDTAEDLWLK